MDVNAFTKPAGSFMRLESYGDVNCFVPSMLPVEILLDKEAINLLAEASLEVGKLSSAASKQQREIIGTVWLAQKNEAVYSSRIEGTTSTLSEVLVAELNAGRPRNRDALEVLNNYSAISSGIEMLKNGREIDIEMALKLHSILMDGVDGNRKLEAGKLRSQQNWIVSAPLHDIRDATYVPPEPSLIKEHLENLFEYMRTSNENALTKIAIMHYKFEAIHPFSDGNGRIGRALILLYMIRYHLMENPLIGISTYIEKNKSEYYNLLLKTSQENDYLSWIKFFLNGIKMEAMAFRKRAERLFEFREETLAKLEKGRSAKTIAAFEILFEQPIIEASTIRNRLNVSHVTALHIIKRLENAGILHKTLDSKRPQYYACDEILRTISGI
jgi:Fic family protein